MTMWRALFQEVVAHRWRCTSWCGAVLVLGISSALLAFLVGPLLRVIFGGESLSWSPLLHATWGPPPDLDQVRSYLPWLIGGVALIKALSFYCERVTRGMIVRQTGRSLRIHLMRWALALSEDQRRALGQDEVRARLTVDVERVERWLESGGAALIRDGLQVILLAMSAIMVSGWAGVIIMSVYPVLILPIIWASRRLKRAARQEISSAHQLGRWAAYVEAHLSRAQAQNQGDTLMDALTQQHGNLERAQSRLAHLQGVAPSFTELSVSWVIAGSLAGFILGLESGWWSAEELMSLFVCILMLYAPVKSLGRAQQQWVTGRVALERVLVSTTSSASQRRSQTTQALKLNCFQPVRGETLQGQPLSAQIVRGELVALVGANGAGKSSVVMAIAGLVPAQGELWVQGEGGEWCLAKSQDEKSDESDERRDEERWRRYDINHINWAAQPPKIFAHELQALCHRSKTDPHSITADLLRGLSLDLDALRIPQSDSASEREPPEVSYWDWFQELSSGERQRLALVTALTQPADIILLDEPEAHLDDQGMRVLVSTLRELSAERIVIIATHSEALLTSCDQVIRLRRDGMTSDAEQRTDADQNVETIS